MSGSQMVFKNDLNAAEGLRWNHLWFTVLEAKVKNLPKKKETVKQKKIIKVREQVDPNFKPNIKEN